MGVGEGGGVPLMMVDGDSSDCEYGLDLACHHEIQYVTESVTGTDRWSCL